MYDRNYYDIHMIRYRFDQKTRILLVFITRSRH